MLLLSKTKHLRRIIESLKIRDRDAIDGNCKIEKPFEDLYLQTAFGFTGKCSFPVNAVAINGVSTVTFPNIQSSLVQI